MGPEVYLGDFIRKWRFAVETPPRGVVLPGKDGMPCWFRCLLGSVVVIEFGLVDRPISISRPQKTQHPPFNHHHHHH